MKIILTESQLKRLINEQVPLGNLLDVGSNWTTDSSVPGSSIPSDISGSNSSSCKNPKNKRQLVMELFAHARKVKGQSKTTDSAIQEKVKKLSNLQNLENVIGQIKTIEELGSVLNGYAKTYGHNLSDKIDLERSKKVWDKLMRFSSGVITNFCNSSNSSTTSLS